MVKLKNVFIPLI